MATVTPQAKAAATRKRNRQVAELAGRDLDVFRLLPTMTNRQIADTLGVSEDAVQRTTDRLRRQLGVRSRVALARLAGRG